MRAANFSVTVLHTDGRATRAALQQANVLACDLGAAVELLHVAFVPYPLSMDHPPVDRAVLEAQIRAFAEVESVATRIRICYGRDLDSSLRASLNRESIIVVGARSRWWFGRELRLARRLTRHGYHVLLAMDSRRTRGWPAISTARPDAASTARQGLASA